PGRSSTTVTYAPIRGWAAGVILNQRLEKGAMTLALVHGRGVLEGFTLYGDTAITDEKAHQARAVRNRVVVNTTYNFNPKFSLLALFGQDVADSGEVEGQSLWRSFGLRPVIFQSDRFQWVGEIGISGIRIDKEKNGDGTALGERSLFRATFGPQLGLKPDVWARPVMRFLVSRTWWNRQNEAKISAIAPHIATELASTSVVYQAEVWF
ncbi:MAG: carbohydrate porin, partial [Bdellovibrionaceae bacterium]|nr:carbohydrate porin [Pseudobdellovibrionaceae bacterium]